MRGCPMRPDRENRATEHAARWWLAVLVLATFEVLLGNYIVNSPAIVNHVDCGNICGPR